MLSAAQATLLMPLQKPAAAAAGLNKDLLFSELEQRLTEAGFEPKIIEESNGVFIWELDLPELQQGGHPCQYLLGTHCDEADQAADSSFDMRRLRSRLSKLEKLRKCAMCDVVCCRVCCRVS